MDRIRFSFHIRSNGSKSNQISPIELNFAGPENMPMQNMRLRKVKRVDIPSFLHKCGFLLYNSNHYSNRNLAIINMIIIQLFLWSWAIKEATILFIDESSEWNYLLGNYSPSFGEKFDPIFDQRFLIKSFLFHLY